MNDLVHLLQKLQSLHEFCRVESYNVLDGSAALSKASVSQNVLSKRQCHLDLQSALCRRFDVSRSNASPFSSDLQDLTVNGAALLLDTARKLYKHYKDLKSGQSNYFFYNGILLYAMGEKPAFQRSRFLTLKLHDVKQLMLPKHIQIPQTLLQDQMRGNEIAII
ncbi:hypothetical protein Cgig2_031963 [Carnegiea gigantea]|uniref:Uncharacterized protein n=1 Tax=Carnegiea gigantea TaxID=171969 RepID=A0A9Q1QCU4_9CARY|nr:hypothetical protein Cgig2_031963 [Carnegiea gigantea]